MKTICALLLPLALLASCSSKDTGPDSSLDTSISGDGAIDLGSDLAAPPDTGSTADGGEKQIRLGLEVTTTVISIGPNWQTPFRHPLRCPEGALAIGLSVAGPDPNLLPNQEPYSADWVGLLCEGGNDPDPGYSLPAGFTWHALQCPPNTVATRISAQIETNDAERGAIIEIGVQCQDRQSIADGLPTDPVNAVPPSYGTGDSADATEVACPAGTALAGLARSNFVMIEGGLGGMSQFEGLCRTVLYSATTPQPVTLGPVTTTTAIALSDLGLPDVPPETRRCPDGEVVTAIDIGDTYKPGIPSLKDLQVTCRQIHQDGQVEAETRYGPVTNAPSTARCLLGWGVQRLELGPVRFDEYGLAGDLSVYCVPVPLAAADGFDLEERPGTPPSTPHPPNSLNSPDAKQIGCPDGAVLVGLQLYNLDNLWPDGSGSLGGIALECQEILGSP